MIKRPLAESVNQSWARPSTCALASPYLHLRPSCYKRAWLYCLEVAGQDTLCTGWSGFAGTLFAAMHQVWLTRSERSQVTDSCQSP